MISPALLMAEEPAVYPLPPLTVIAPHGTIPLQVVVDPRAPMQPLPSQDGADLLRSVAGFNIIRKGGTDGDPVFRGLSGSRLGILIDGELIFGGCGSRMDPPTAYVFPAAFDSLTIVKGPQSVLHGPGMSAGVVLFERKPVDCTTESLSGVVGLTLGSYGRNDQLMDFAYAQSGFSAAATLTRSSADDYKDGDGRKISSQYERWSAHFVGRLNLTESTRLELTGIISDGEAAYADRSMDGVKFARENMGMRFVHSSAGGGWFAGVEGLAYYNYVDHVMDNYSLRTFRPTAIMPHPTVSNPDRETFGTRLLVQLQNDGGMKATVGAEYQVNRHSLRRSMNQVMLPYEEQARVRDASFASPGLFLEASVDLTSSGRLMGGLRMDFWRAEDSRATIAAGMMSLPNPTAGETRRDALPAGFLRYEHRFGESLIAYAGFGHVQRFPDYWELINKESASSLSAFHLDAERTTQLDIGWSRSGEQSSFGLSLFANRIDDYILIQSGFAKGMRQATISRSVAVSQFGLEATAHFRISDRWRVDGAIAYVRGRNRTDELPLAQQPPLEGRIALGYHQPTWSIGTLARFVARQHRVVPGQGSIVGQDIGPSAGYSVFSLHADWRPRKSLRFAAGIDNLLDRAYAGHLSRGGVMVAGFPLPTTRVTEPGRTFWLTGECRF